MKPDLNRPKRMMTTANMMSSCGIPSPFISPSSITCIRQSPINYPPPDYHHPTVSVAHGFGCTTAEQADGVAIGHAGDEVAATSSPSASIVQPEEVAGTANLSIATRIPDA
jgi:hypothetical protein